MTGRAEIYRGGPGAAAEPRGRGWAARRGCPRPRGRSDRTGCRWEWERGGRLGRASSGRPSARTPGGGTGASGAPGGEARAPRPSRALRVCQFLETSRPGAGSGRGDRPGAGVGCPPRLLRGRRVSRFPARRAHRSFLFLFILRPEARSSPGAGFSGWQRRCVCVCVCLSGRLSSGQGGETDVQGDESGENLQNSNRSTGLRLPPPL